MLRVYRYRLCPTRGQDGAMRELLERLRELYNAALEHRREAYRRQRVSVSAYAQMRELVDVRAERPEYAAVHTHLLQDAITRVDRAFRGFFRRCRAGEKPGYPRFRGRGRYRTFTFKDAIRRNGVALVAGGKRVRIAGIGNVRVRLHRPLEGRIKQASVTLAGDGHWYIAFACDEVAPKPLPATGRSVGVDVGIRTFASLSDGVAIGNPRPYLSAQRDVACAQRVVSRRKRGSKRRRKAVALLAKRHDQVRRVRHGPPRQGRMRRPAMRPCRSPRHESILQRLRRLGPQGPLRARPHLPALRAGVGSRRQRRTQHSTARAAPSGRARR